MYQLVTSSSHSHSHSHPEAQDLHPHTDLDALDQAGDDPSIAVHSSALRTEKIAKFLEAHFGDVDVVETREVEAGEDTDDVPGDTAMRNGDEELPANKIEGAGDTEMVDATDGAPQDTVKTATDDVESKDGKLLLFDPAIVVKLDEWEARIGLLDLVSSLRPLLRSGF